MMLRLTVLVLALVLGGLLFSEYRRYRADRLWWDSCVEAHSEGYCQGQLQAR